jgi:hypothetical protein
VDGVVTCSLTGHVTEKMRLYYSTVGMNERRAAVTAVAELLGPMGDREGSGPVSRSPVFQNVRRQLAVPRFDRVAAFSRPITSQQRSAISGAATRRARLAPGGGSFSDNLGRGATIRFRG